MGNGTSAKSVADDIDYIHPLSQIQRRHHLLDGYIRSFKIKPHIPSDIKSLCLEYLSTIHITSQTEIDRANEPPDKAKYH